jgi:hypothetical protein
MILRIKLNNKVKEVNWIDCKKEVPAKCDAPSRVHLFTLYLTKDTCKVCT